MANPAPRPAPPSPRPTRSTRRLELTRHGNDNYTLEEQTLEGDGVTWRTSATRTLCARVSRNVVASYVEDWVRTAAGRDFMGDTGL